MNNTPELRLGTDTDRLKKGHVGDIYLSLYYDGKPVLTRLWLSLTNKRISDALTVTDRFNNPFDV